MTIKVMAEQKLMIDVPSSTQAAAKLLCLPEFSVRIRLIKFRCHAGLILIKSGFILA